MSDILGEFSETFRFALEGSSEMLTLTFKGHVVAPTFRFSEDIIDFGRISYKFDDGTYNVWFDHGTDLNSGFHENPKFASKDVRPLCYGY